MTNYDMFQHYIGVGMSFLIKKKMLDIPLNEIDRKYCNLFKASTLVYKSFERLSMIYSLIEKVPQKFFFDEHEIYEDDYLKYHIENYLTSIVSMLDKLSILINLSYDLGIKNKCCSFKILLNKHKDLVPSSLMDMLLELDDMTKDLRKLRNHIVHEGEFDDEEWFMLSGLALLDRKSETTINQDQLRSEVNKEYEKYTKLFKNNNEIISLKVWDIFEALTPTIKEKAEEAMNSTPHEMMRIYEELEKVMEINKQALKASAHND